MSRRSIALGIAALLAGTLALGFVALNVEGLFGWSSGYRARDNDRALTAIAREAKPMIEAITSLRASHGQCPRPDDGEDLKALRAMLPGSMKVESFGNSLRLRMPGGTPGWLYDVSGWDPASCGLWRKLGWDPALRWDISPDGARWTFIPGDGSDEVEISLDLSARR
jgi:hypothetical protein